MQGKQILVTGGCGFIGSHLVRKLNDLGARITLVDDLSSGDLTNISDLMGEMSFIQCRVEDLNFENLPKYDGLFHLAAQASVPYSIENFFASSKSNMDSSLKLIDYCSKTHTPFVYASSSAIYGNIDLGLETGKTDFLSPYSVDKYSMELFCRMAKSVYGLRSFGLRFFNVYGPNQDPKNPYSGVISIFLDRLLKGKEIIINGGHQTRDFVYVEDVVLRLIYAFNFLQLEDACAISNILTGKTISIKNLGFLVADILGIKPEIIYKELPAGDPLISDGDITTMHKYFGTDDMCDLKTGLNKTIHWTRARV